MTAAQKVIVEQFISAEPCGTSCGKQGIVFCFGGIEGPIRQFVLDLDDCRELVVDVVEDSRRLLGDG